MKNAPVQQESVHIMSKVSTGQFYDKLAKISNSFFHPSISMEDIDNLLREAIAEYPLWNDEKYWHWKEGQYCREFDYSTYNYDVGGWTEKWLGICNYKKKF